jgi:hypothetical protein
MSNSRSGRHLSFDKIGQIRVLEVVVAVTIIVVALSLSSLLLGTARTWHFRRTEELSKSAFSVLSYLSKSGSLDANLVRRPEGWEYGLKNLIDNLVPANTVFVLEVSAYDSGGWVDVCQPISNDVQMRVENIGPDVGSATYIYTGADRLIYRLRLMISSRG